MPYKLWAASLAEMFVSAFLPSALLMLLIDADRWRGGVTARIPSSERPPNKKRFVSSLGLAAPTLALAPGSRERGDLATGEARTDGKRGR